ncbi:hypothetical protein [Pedobacter antarcticus]|uniref:hypothetical protein n=1 Tax=Pedobacter antarcticus TaxID=34086 RepID=UPI000AB8E7A6|nr:hypothetical protein [Pedobacter antarcticus]
MNIPFNVLEGLGGNTSSSWEGITDGSFRQEEKTIQKAISMQIKRELGFFILNRVLKF